MLLQHITHHGNDVIGITNYIQTTVATQMELPSYSAQGRLIMAVPASRSQSPAHLGCCELQHSQDPAGHLQYSTVAKGMGKCSHFIQIFTWTHLTKHQPHHTVLGLLVGIILVIQLEW